MNPEILSRVFRGWRFLGLAGLGFLFAFAIAHWIFGVPLYDRDSGQVASEAEAIWLLVILIAGFSLFAVAGFLGVRFMHRRTQDNVHDR
jgi:biotin transporter BioY